MDELHLFIYGEIGGGMFSEDQAATSEEIQKQISEHPAAKEIILHVSSAGGGVFEGWTIGNIIKNSGKKTTALIEGFCASIATYIALSCDRVEMSEVGSRFLIHNPSLGLEGDQEDLEQAAKQLDSIKDDLLTVYRAKTGLSIPQLSEMMSKETSMTAQEAKDFGFIDDFMTPIKAVAKFDIKNKTMAEEKKEVKKETEEKVDLTGLQKIIDKGTELYKESIAKLEGLLPKAKNVVVELADGTKVFVDSEDGEFEGKKIFTVDEDGNGTDTPIADGTLTLSDERTITVESGVIVSVQEAPPSEVDLLTAKVAELEAEMTASAEEKATVEKEKASVEETVKETKKEMAEIMTEMKNYKKLVVADVNLKKPLVKAKAMADEEQEEGHSLDGFGRYLHSEK